MQEIYSSLTNLRDVKRYMFENKLIDHFGAILHGNYLLSYLLLGKKLEIEPWLDQPGSHSIVEDCIVVQFERNVSISCTRCGKYQHKVIRLRYDTYCVPCYQHVKLKAKNIMAELGQVQWEQIMMRYLAFAANTELVTDVNKLIGLLFLTKWKHSQEK